MGILMKWNSWRPFSKFISLILMRKLNSFLPFMILIMMATLLKMIFQQFSIPYQLPINNSKHKLMLKVSLLKREAVWITLAKEFKQWVILITFWKCVLKVKLILLPRNLEKSTRKYQVTL